MGHLAGDVGEPEFSTVVTVREFGVVEADEVQDRRVQVVDRHAVFDRVVAELVGLAVAESAFDTAARHPHRESIRMMIAAGIGLVARLHRRRAPELPAPENECVVEHAAGFQVEQQAGDRFVDLADVDRVTFLEVRVLVPLFIVKRQGVGVAHLNEAHATLGETPREQAFAAEVLGLRIVEAIEFFGGL